MPRTENNLTEGSVAKNLLSFSLPFIISNIIQSLYSVADFIIVGKFSDTNNMSGVNIGGQVTTLVTNAVIGVTVGATVLIGQYMGANKKKDMKETIGTLFTTLFSLAFVITAVMLLLNEPLLRLINTPEESFAASKSYFDITLLGTVFIFGYNALSSVMRGMGDSKNPLIFVSIACAVNVVLDLVLVAGYDMGAKGAAIATVISQAISMVCCIIYLKRKNFIFDFALRSFKISWNKLSMLLKIGIPTMLNNITVSVSFLFITSFVNSLGVIESAAVGAVGKFNSFAILPAVAMGSAVSAMCAQNIGAGKTDRAVKTMKIGMLIAVCISYSIFAVTQLFPEVFIRMFNDDPALIEAGVSYIRVFSFDYLVVPLVFCLNGLFIGSGHTTFSLINGIISSLAARVPASYLLGSVMGKGLAGYGLGAPIASATALAAGLIFLFSGRWKKQVVLKHSDDE